MNAREESYLQYLPAVLAPETPQSSDFLRRFLHIFEDIFSSLEQKVDDIPKLFNPWRVPSEFLPWLASWLALDLDQAWDERQARSYIRQITSLYKQRGTLLGLEKYLQIYVGSNMRIEELPVEAAPHLFQVTINLPERKDASRRVALSRQVRAIIDAEKPAHTHYNLVIKNPTLQIGKYSHIGVDTILGTL
jgi:phage tail-like protein